jgi:acetylornithine deacetylase/succinyl-diaminopimelate desuccinylase-like protein
MANAEYSISLGVQDAVNALMNDEGVMKGLRFLEADHERTVGDQIAICEIPAPSYKEEERTKYLCAAFKKLGLKNVTVDSVGNVLGIRPGIENGPKLVVAAHIDTVFPNETDIKVKENDGKLYGPSIADDSRGVAELLSLIRAFNETCIETLGDVVFCGDVCEEGLGNLKGSKQLFADHADIDGFISLDGTGVASIVYAATGSYRYKIVYRGPGGHSYTDFGASPSAVHALGRAIAALADLEVPTEPKTTYSVGVINGGTSINVIAEEASMLVDLRSNTQEELNKTESKFKEIVQKACDAENSRCKSTGLSVEITLLGSRPAGSQSTDEIIVQAACAGLKAIGIEPNLRLPSSTDANVPISLGIPALAVGRGGESGQSHSVHEWFDPKDAFKGPQKDFITILSLVGAKNICEPLLLKKQPRQ